MPKKILVALDGSDLAEGVLPQVESLVQADSEIHLVRAVTVHLIREMDKGQVERYVVEEAEKYLRQIERHLKKKGLSVQSHVLLGKAAESILDFAEKENCDLIAITTHGLSGLGRWVLGSVAEKVVRGSRVPVFVSPSRR